LVRKHKNDYPGKESKMSKSFENVDRRLVAAVNAVQGMPTEALENGDLQRALELAWRALVDVYEKCECAKYPDRGPCRRCGTHIQARESMKRLDPRREWTCVCFPRED
jgi:surfactin synthase thioesterase subunit